MDKFYIAFRENPVNIMMGRHSHDAPGECGVCADMSDVIDYLDEAHAPVAREDVLYEHVPLPDVDVMYTVTQPGYRVPVKQYEPLTVSSKVFESVDIQSVALKVDADVLFKDITRRASVEDYRKVFSDVKDELHARAVILAECIKLAHANDNPGIISWYADVAATQISAPSLLPLPTKEWAEKFVELYKEAEKRDERMSQADVTSVASLNTAEYFAARAGHPAHQAIMNSIIAAKQPEMERVLLNMCARNFKFESYLPTLLTMLPKEEHEVFAQKFKAAYNEQLRAPGGNVQDASLVAATQVARMQSFVCFQQGRHDVQNHYDEIVDKAGVDTARWESLTRDGREDVEREDD